MTKTACMIIIIYQNTYLHYFLVEVRVVHVKDGCLDVPSCRETLDLDEDIVCPALIQHSDELAMFYVDLQVKANQNSHVTMYTAMYVVT